MKNVVFDHEENDCETAIATSAKWVPEYDQAEDRLSVEVIEFRRVSEGRDFNRVTIHTPRSPQGTLVTAGQVDGSEPYVVLNIGDVSIFLNEHNFQNVVDAIEAEMDSRVAA